MHLEHTKASLAHVLERCDLRWSMIAAQLPGRTDNEIKNYWNTHMKKQLRQDALDVAVAGEGTAAAQLARAAAASSCPAARHMAQWETARLEAEARLSLLSSSATTTITSATASSSSSTAVAEHAAPWADLQLCPGIPRHTQHF